MARCRCTEESCVCRLTAGPGISMSGSGSPSNPWVVSSPVVATGTVGIQDTASLNLTQTGAGTVSNPYLIHGDVALDPLLDVADTADVDLALAGAGTSDSPFVLSAAIPKIDLDTVAITGQVLTMMADGIYKPGPPATAAPGAVLVGPGLSGDGSVGNPLRVDVCTYGDLKALCAP